VALLERARNRPVGAPRLAPPLAAGRPPEFAFRRVPQVAFVGVLVLVLAFSKGWRDGRMALDGVGAAMLVREALEHWFASGHVPYWLAGMWTGTPLYGLAPSLPTLDLVPLASVVGPEPAVRIAILSAQVAGGWGAYVLAASLWGSREPAAAVAGVVYALHPLVISHGALFGHQPAVWVIAATPWLAWSFRRALRGGRGAVPLAGGIAAFAILQQAEHAYALVLMCACQLAIELPRHRRAAGGLGVGAVLRRAAVAAGVGIGLIAFWLFPFLTLHDSFVLTPPASVRADLTVGPGSSLGQHPAAWLARPGEQPRVVSFQSLLGTFRPSDGPPAGIFYLSWVCVLLTFVSIALLRRREQDGHLTAILLASLIGVWLTSAGVSLADSRIVADRRFVVLAVLGLVVGLLLYSYLCGLRIRRPVAAAITLGCLMVMPYLTPFLSLRRFVPFLANIRFPRFYPIAALALALGAAFPLLLVARWARSRARPWHSMLTVAACLLVVAAFMLDIAPYRSYYRMRPPDTAAYEQALSGLAEVGGSFRVGTLLFGDPRPVDELAKRGRLLSVGWPHPMASKRVYRLAGEPFIAPLFYRNHALGLSGTAYTVTDQLDPTQTRVEKVRLVRNPQVLPIVRAYDSAVVVEEEAIAPELAVALARRNVAVVTGGSKARGALAGLSAGQVGAGACDPQRTASAVGGLGGLAGEVAMACAAHRWIGVETGFDTLRMSDIGAVFTAPLDGLRGVNVYLDRPGVGAELELRPVGAEGGAGPPMARSAGVPVGAEEMTLFPFDPIPDSAGKSYAMTLACPACPAGGEPRMVVAEAQRGPGTLLTGGRLDRARVAAFSLIYDGVGGADPSGTEVQADTTEAGRWRIRTSGPRPSLIVVAAAWFPGWVARVDGRPAPVLVADGAFLGVAVPAGDHEVTLVYKKPAAANIGLLTTVATLFGVIFLRPGGRVRRQLARRRPAGDRTRPGAAGHRRSSGQRGGKTGTG